MKASTRLLASLVVCAAATAAAATLTTRSAAAAGNPSADLDQCANGPIYAPVPCTGTAWQNGNTNANNSHWYEGGSIAYRMKFSSLTPGSTHYVTIQWDTTKGGKHALDYLTAYNRTEVDGNDPCSGVAGCSVPPTTFPIPPDPHVSSLPQPSPDDGRWNQVFTMFNGTIKSVSAYSLTGAYDSDSSTIIRIGFTASSANAVLAWGAHIATRKDWGANNSALAITGSPYHMSLVDLDGSGGSQDRSTASSAVIFPAILTVTKTVLDSYGNELIGPWPFNFTTTSPSLGNGGPELPPSFTLVNDGGINEQTGLPDNQRQFKLYVFGTTSSQVTITEQPRTDFVLASLTCSSTLNGIPQTDTSVNLATATAAIVPAEGEEISCTYVNQQALTLTVIKQVINAYEGTAGPSAFTLRVTGSNGISRALPGSATGTPYPVLPGTYTVTEEGPLDIYRLVGFSGDCDASGMVVLAPGDAKTCIVTNADIPKTNPTVATNMRWVLNDSLTLTGWRPGGSGGTVTFKLYGPDDAQCLGSVINGTGGSGEVRPLQTGSAATAAGFNLQEAQLANLRGTFRWIAEYSGDTYNDPAATKCGDEAHTIVVHDPSAYLLAQFLTPVNGATDVNISQPIQWTAVPDAQAYYLYVGSSPGMKDIVNTGELQTTSYQPAGLPIGQLLYARLWTKRLSVWKYTDITFTAASGANMLKATVISPANGATGVNPILGVIQWTAMPNAQKYYVYVGSTPGAKDLIDSQEICPGCINSTTATSWSLANAGKPPAVGLAGKAGQKVYLRLWTVVDGAWLYSDSTFTLAP